MRPHAARTPDRGASEYMKDVSRTMFIVSATLIVLIGTFLAGLYSARADNRVAQAVLGTFDDMYTLVEEIPNMMRSRPIHFLAPARYKGNGLTVNSGGKDDLLLMTGFLGDDQKVQLMERNGKVLASWRLLPKSLLPNIGQCRNPPQTDWNTSSHNTIIQPDGSIILSFESCGMVKMNRFGAVMWATKEITHHSPNFLENGNIVIGGSEYVKGPRPWPFKTPYWEDVVRIYDAQGRPVFHKRITDLFLQNQMAPLLTSASEDKPMVDGEFHLNEIEQLPAAYAKAFPMFAPGDLLISLRNLNMVLVTDAKVEKIKWYRIGPWIRQHDPDWQPDGTITVFDNHPGQGNGGSRIVSVNPATGTARTLYGGVKGQMFLTPERGLHQFQPDGSILITEANAGRAFEVDGRGRITWEYVNRFDKDSTAWLNGVESKPRSYFTVTNWSCPASRK